MAANPATVPPPVLARDLDSALEAAVHANFSSRISSPSPVHTQSRPFTFSAGEDGYDMADRLGGPRANVGAGGDSLDMRKYKRRAYSPSIMTKSDDDVSGVIVKTTDITIGYPMESDQAGNTRSHENRPASIDSMV